MLLKVKRLGNEKSILSFIVILPFIFGLLLTMPLPAWQVVALADSTIRINTQLLTDSLPNLPSTVTLHDLKNSIDSLQSWQSRLSSYPLNTDSLTPGQLQQVITLKANGDSLLNNLETRQNHVETKINQLENKAINLQDSIYEALQQKIGQLRASGKLTPEADSLRQKLNHLQMTRRLNHEMGQLEIPDEVISKDQVGEMDQLINQLKHDKISSEFISDIDQKLFGLKGALQQKEQLAAVNTEIAAMKSAFKEDFEQFSQKINPDWLKRQQDQLQQWQQYTDGIKDYGNEVVNTPKTLEQRARELEEIQAFEGQKNTFSPYQQQIEELGKEDYVKEQAMQKAKTMARDHFAGQQEKLKAAQSKLTRLKQRMGKSGRSGLNGEKLKKQNPMKDKTLGERLVLGGNFQLHPGEEVSLDISPTLAYRWTKMLRLGLGGTYRTTFDEKERFFLSDENEVFGYRGFAEHEVYKGFFAHVEYERLQSGNRSAQKSAIGDENGDAWQNSALAGLGKSYKIRNKIKGHVMLLYNFLYDEHSLYDNPWNVRFGFELMEQGSKKNKSGKIEKQKE